MTRLIIGVFEVEFSLMVTVDQIRMQIRQVLDGSLSRDSFDEWISVHSWNMHLDSSADAISLLGKVELAMAEYDGEHLSEPDLLKQFRNLIAFEFRLDPFFSTGSDSKLQTFSFQSGRLDSSDKPLGMVFSHTLHQAS